jgi:hypothetical protein
MNIIIQYECDVCKRRYTTEEDAKECESMGVFDNRIYPPGLMFPYKHHALVGIFSIPKEIPFYQGDKHLGSSASWACRNTNVGDSLGSETCGGNFYRSDHQGFQIWLSNYHMSNKDMSTKEFARMVGYLRGAGIQPSYYDKKGKLHTV